VSERKRLEAQLQQSQKMETVGRLAGGLAHDFNNLLTVILGNAELVLDGGGGKEGVQDIVSAAERAAALTRQLLAFSRKQVLEMKVVNLNGVVSSVEKMLRRLLDDEQAGSVAIVGLSLGGMIAQAFALRWPDRVRALVLANSMSRVAPPMRAAWLQRRQAARAQGMASQVWPTLQRWFRPEFVKTSPLMMQWVGSMIASVDVGGYLTAISAIQGLDYLDRLTEIRVPTLVVTGSDDVMVSPAVAAEMAARIPNGELQVIQSAAHLSNIEQSVVFTETVGAFLSYALSAEAETEPVLRSTP